VTICTAGFFVRAGFPKTCALRREASPPGGRAPTNRVFCTDEKHIRAKNTVMVNTKQDLRVSNKIADCARMCFSSVRNRRSARTDFRPRNVAARQ
jgi:hypothetical protein